MELCQGDNTPSPKQTNQEHTSRSQHMVFNTVVIAWKNNQVDKSVDTKPHPIIGYGI